MCLQLFSNVVVSIIIVGHRIGSLQAVKENLRRMRWKRERIKSMSSSSDAGSGHGALCKISTELVQYVEGYSNGGETASEELGDSNSVNPHIIAVAMEHQQSRAEVSGKHILNIKI